MTQWTFDEKQQTGQLRVDGAVTIVQVGQLKALLVQAVDQAHLVLVDLSRVEQVDVAGLQLLCAAHRFACASGKGLKIAGVGERFRVLACSAGFAHEAWCSVK